MDVAYMDALEATESESEDEEEDEGGEGGAAEEVVEEEEEDDDAYVLNSEDTSGEAMEVRRSTNSNPDRTANPHPDPLHSS